MSGVKVLKNRISSIKAIEKITKTISMVATARIASTKMLIKSAAISKEQISRSVNSCTSNTLTNPSNNISNHYLLIGSQKGLCGGFNNKLIRFFKDHINNRADQKQKINVILVGTTLQKAAKNEFAHSTLKNMINFYPLDQTNDIDQLMCLAQNLMDKIKQLNTDSLTLLYQHCKNALNIFTKTCVLKIKNPDLVNAKDKIEINDEFAMERLHSHYILFNIYYCLLSSKIAEESSRMISMNNVAKNCSDLSDKLTLAMNRVRQYNITKEIIEITSASQAQ